MKRIVALINYAILVAMLASGMASAYTIDTGHIDFRQPNNVIFKGRQWGSGFNIHQQTHDGYEFMKGRGGYYYYAKLDERSKVATRFGLKVATF